MMRSGFWWSEQFRIGTPPSPRPAPPKPTRDQVCGMDYHFQGLRVTTQQLGPDRPWFDPDIMQLEKLDRLAVYAAHRAVGDTHLNLSIDLGGLDTLPRLLDIATEAILEGGLTGIILMCCGDGQIVQVDRIDRRDPGALGYEWLMANFQVIVVQASARLIGDHCLADHILFCPGYDGCIPTWQPFTKVNAFVRMARHVLDLYQTGHLALLPSAGYCVWSGEDNDWTTEDGRCVDVILQQLPMNMGPPDPVPSNWSALSNEQKQRWTQVYQMIGRMVRPYYPIPGQPDDLHPPFLLAGGTPRGPYYYVVFEYDTNQDTSIWRVPNGRGMSVAEVERHREAIYAMGAIYVS